MKAAPDYFLLAQLAQLSHTPNGERTTHTYTHKGADTHTYTDPERQNVQL